MFELFVAIGSIVGLTCAIAFVIRPFYKSAERMRRDEWRRVPPPNWACKRGGLEIW